MLLMYYLGGNLQHQMPVLENNQERSQINYLCFKFKSLAKEEKIKYYVRRRKKIINIRVKVNEPKDREQ